MRLFQLARKLEVPPESIVAFLSENSISIESRSNAKLEEEHVKLIIRHFESVEEQWQDTPKSEQPVPETPEPNVEITETDDDPLPPDQSLEDEFVAGDTSEDIPSESPMEAEEEIIEEKEIEVIRVKKIKLTGPKVVGKIDLPEPVKKEKTETSSEEDTHRSPRQRYRNKRQFDKKRKREETPEQIRRREAREKARKKREEDKRKKEQRKRYYMENVQASIEVKAKPKKKKKTASNDQAPAKVQRSKHVVKHKNPIKRFWAWLNGAYDNY